jgi:hypothetical protein
MSDVLGRVVQVRVLAYNVREGMMTDHMLMEPGVRGTKHEADIHGTLIY